MFAGCVVLGTLLKLSIQFSHVENKTTHRNYLRRCGKDQMSSSRKLSYSLEHSKCLTVLGCAVIPIWLLSFS